jgi:hypothetical protein
MHAFLSLKAKIWVYKCFCSEGENLSCGARCGACLIEMAEQTARYHVAQQTFLLNFNISHIQNSASSMHTRKERGIGQVREIFLLCTENASNDQLKIWNIHSGMSSFRRISRISK